MDLPAIQINPIAARQLNFRLRSTKHDMPFEAVQHDVARNMMWGNFSACSHDKPHGFEALRLDERDRFRVTKILPQRPQVDDFSRLCVSLRHDKPTFPYNIRTTEFVTP